MARLEKHLRSKCLVCLGSLEVPFSRLSCCRTRVHEECLLKWFVHSKGQIPISCPHCKQTIFPFNLTEGPPWCISLVFFRFHLHVSISRHYSRNGRTLSGVFSIQDQFRHHPKGGPTFSSMIGLCVLGK